MRVVLGKYTTSSIRTLTVGIGVSPIQSHALLPSLGSRGL